MNLSTRKQAKLNNESKYYTGNPCPKGHIAYRYTNIGLCVECRKEINKLRDYKQMYANRPKEIRAKYLQWQKQNPEKVSVIRKRYRKNNPNKINARNNKRRAARINACPVWVSTKELEEIYLKCPKGLVVHHIVPLINPIVCGLHVPWNLQYLTVSKNLKKGNKLLACYL